MAEHVEDTPRFLARLIRERAGEIEQDAPHERDDPARRQAAALYELAQTFERLSDNTYAHTLHALAPTHAQRDFPSEQTLALIDAYGRDDPADADEFFRRLVEIESGAAIDVERP